RDLADAAGAAARRVGGATPGARLRRRAAPPARARHRRRRAGRVLPLVPRRIPARAGVDGPESPEPGRTGLPDDATGGDSRALTVRLRSSIRGGRRADLQDRRRVPAAPLPPQPWSFASPWRRPVRA